MPQDDAREISMRKTLKLLESGEGRDGLDAIDEFGNKFELKTSFKKSQAVSTARAVNRTHMRKWRTHHWIIGMGSNYQDGFMLNEFYYLSPTDMEEWIQGIEKKIDEFEKISEFAIQCVKDKNADTDIIYRLEKILKTGSILNDPNISKSYIVEHGTKLYEPYDVSLREIMSGVVSSETQIQSTLMRFYEQPF